MISVSARFPIISPIEETITKVLLISPTANFTTTGFKVNFLLRWEIRKAYFYMKKDPDTFIAEQLKKPPCHRFATEGHCSYGLACTYGHFSFNQNTGNKPHSTLIFSLHKTFQI